MESGSVENLELEQAAKRVEELRGCITIRMRRSWKILSTMP